MRLKRIELAGFKSFVDPTRIELGDGITAIVGPNGCGKSNIVDAVRWVLGEHSARHLRGGVMDDLIFQGSERRPPVGLCDVELTFAIEENQLPPPYHEMTEISVRRRLTRETGSDAFINGKAVRIKDIIDLFLDTGVSSHAYAVVEQGQIDRLISARPEERRLILEEAAGIMKYRARRREAERKMADTEQNLERVMDLLEEVRSQCRSLRQQASRAERFKKLQDEWHQVQQISLAIRYRRRLEAYRREEQEVTRIKTTEAQTAQQQAAAERTLNEARQALLDHDAAAANAQDALRQKEQQRADVQREAERLAGERRLLSERKTILEQRLEENATRLARVRSDAAALARQLRERDDAALKTRVQQADETVQALKQAHGDQQRRREALLADYERLRGEQSAVEERNKQASLMIERINKRLTQLEQLQDEAEQQLARSTSELASSEAAVNEARQRQDQAVTALAEAEQRLQQARDRQAALSNEFAGEEVKLRQLSGAVQELRARLQRQSVPDDLRRAVQEHGGTWVDDAIDVPQGLELAVAAALRGQAGDACLPADPHCWQQPLAATAGTAVAFYTGETGDAAAASLAEALTLTPAHPLHDMFATVALAERIDQAPAMLANDTACTAVVSLDGWLLERGGWLVAPAHTSMVRRLEQQRELHEQEQALANAEKVHAHLADELHAAEAEVAERQQQWQQAHVAATEEGSRLAAVQAQVQRQTAEKEAAAARLTRLQVEWAELQTGLSHWQELLARGGQGDAAALDAAQQQLAAQTNTLGQAEAELAQARHDLAAAEQALALHVQAFASFDRDRQRLDNERAQLEAQIEADKKRLAAVAEEMRQTENQSELDARLKQAHAAVEQAHATLNRLRQQGHELQRHMREAEKHEREARQRHTQALEQRQQAEVKLAGEQAHLQDLASEIEQRCRQQAETLLASLEAMAHPPDAEEILHRSHDLEDRLNRFGPVNLLAIDEFRQASEREQFLSEQAADLEVSLHTLADTIKRIDRTTRSRFVDAFERANAIFRDTFPCLFGGGRAELRLDGDDPLIAGVDIIAQPPGKHLQDIGLLSGGEKALTAVALVFSIFRMKPAPFCILDEVDAPLDDTNVGRFGRIVRELADEVQFLTVTHNKVTMQAADRIVGVSMPEPGVSRIVGVEMESVAA